MLTLGCLGVAVLWIGFSNQFGPRFIRGLVAETTRGVDEPAFVPRPETWNDNSITAAWLGHSTVLLNIFGLNVVRTRSCFLASARTCVWPPSVRSDWFRPPLRPT